MQLVLLDHVLHSPPGAVELVVKMLRPASGKVGDDEAGIRSHAALSLGSGEDAAFTAPGASGVASLVEAAHAVLVV